MPNEPAFSQMSILDWLLIWLKKQKITPIENIFLILRESAGFINIM